jgi:shikimate 5-dehydrogenase
MKCCLIGKTLKHSYSKIIHEKFGEYPYDLVELNDNEVKDFVLKKEYDAYNVTIPYKEVVMPYLDKIDEFALEIGSVNTVVKRDGKLFGYNTDFSGMKYMERQRRPFQGPRAVAGSRYFQSYFWVSRKRGAPMIMVRDISVFVGICITP